LADRFAAPRVHYESEPCPVGDGWEALVYHFHLRGAESLPPEYRSPLTLRLLACPEGIPRGRHEFEVQRFLRQCGYPVPAPVLWEERCDALGGPFLLMEQIPGPTVLRRLVRRPWTVLAVAEQMAELQARLHRIPVQDFPHLAEPLADRGLNEIEEIIRRYGFRSLNPGLDWLRDRLPEPPATPGILHLDFHPLNLIHRPGHLPAVLDWDMADVGDPHADIATTLLFLRSGPNEGKLPREKIIIEAGRRILEACYLSALRKRLSLDEVKLAFYLALAFLLRLARSGRFLAAGPQVSGAKPSLVRRLRIGHLDLLCGQFRRITGVDLPLEEPVWSGQSV
jgi:aminoglycoside phosphotransferase (APT) family kinase protein